jgi:hypothetical protein
MTAPAIALPDQGIGNATDEVTSETGSKGKPDGGKPDNKGKAPKDNDGDADSDSETAYTEDNDTNDGGTPNNVEDDGDNKHPSGKDRSTEKGKSGNQGKSESDPDDDGRGPDRSNGGPDKPNGSGGEDLADQDGNNGCGNDDDFEDDNEGWCGGKPKPAKPGKAPCDADVTMPGDQPCENDVNDVTDGKITICHATGSMTNPFVVITISVNGLNGHGKHEGDIIPAPAGGCSGLQAVLPGVTPCDADPAMAGTQPCDEEEEPEVREDDAEPDVVLAGDLGNDDEVAAAQNRPQTKVLGAVLPFTGTSILIFLLAALGLIAVGSLALRSRRTS